MTDNWRDDAECKGLDPNLFFPTVGESAAEPKAVCMTCPVRSECREDAIVNHEQHGIWGGLSERASHNGRSV